MIKSHQPYYKKYTSQKYLAGKRGIDWQFTYEEWIDWWGTDIVNRGPKSGQLVMARTGDIGPYHPSNVRKATVEENVSEAHLGKTVIYNKEAALKRAKSNTGKKRTAEQKITMSSAQKNRFSSNPVSEETKKKISAANKPHTKEHEEKRLAAIKAYWANRKSLKEMNNV